MGNTKTNATKTNAMLTVNDLLLYVKKSTENKKCKVFCDTSNYVGVGEKSSNDFSVNVKTKQYNIYCNNKTFELVKTVKSEDLQFTANGNKNDKLRNNVITCKSTEALKKLLAIVFSTFETIAQ